MGCGSKTSSCVAMMKLSWMGWELNAFLIQQPAEILRGASIKSQLWRLWKRSMLRASGFGKSSLGVFCYTPLLIQTARCLLRLESDKEAWDCPTNASWY